MTKFRYQGQPVSNWYGLDLVTGQVLTVPDRLIHKAIFNPMFEAVVKDDPPEVATTATQPAPEPPAVATGTAATPLWPSEPPADASSFANWSEGVQAPKPAPRPRGRPRKG